MTAARRRGSAYLTITTHVPREAAREIQRLATDCHLSVSACAAALLVEGLRVGVEHEHGALLEATVERTIRQCLSAHLERLGDLAFRAALDSDETRRLVIALCFKVLEPDKAKAFRREAHSAAWQRLQEPTPAPPEADGVCQDSRTPS
jgi:hypothetical protein